MLTLMVADHVHHVFFDHHLEWLFWLSRLVFPIFALIVAQNLKHHRANPKRYLLRLLVYGMIAQPFYLACFQVAQLNVMLTFASSIAVWWLLKALNSHGVPNPVRYGLAILIAACTPFLEFGWAGVLAVPVYSALMRRGAWWDWLSGFILAFGIVGFGLPWPMPLVAIGLWSLASKIPAPTGRKPNPWIRHLIYAVYPTHLAIMAMFAPAKV